MLAATMIGGAKYANAVDLLTASPWTVPSGVTTIYINAATQGAGPYSAVLYSGGGGGGAAIINGTLTVSPGDVLSYTLTSESAASGYSYSVYKNTTTLLFLISAGQRGQLAGTAGLQYGGLGGRILWGAQTISGGSEGNGSTPGGDGQVVALTNGGVGISGGGGGGGGTTSPPFTPGSAGGNVGSYLGTSGLSNGFGGAGGGFIPGNGLVSLSPDVYVHVNSSGFVGTSFITINY